MNPIDFRGQRSNVKVIIGERLYNLMNTIKIKPFIVF